MTTTDLTRFAGIFYPDVLQVEELIHPMLDTMAPGIRGGKDILTYKNVQIGSYGSRLSFNDKKTIYACIDGSIENKEELEKSHGFNKMTQGELIIALYEIYKEKIFERLDGSFAIAIFDQTLHNILLCRDRIGKKPLYWYYDQHHLIFASELKAMLATGIIAQTLAADAIAMYLYFGFIPQDVTPIKQVSKLLPGNYLLFNPARGLVVRPYWSYSSFFNKRQDPDPEKVVKTIEELLDTSTSKLLSQTNSVGCFLSGGLGSATVAYEVMKKERAEAFTVGFKGQNDEDVEAAEQVSHSLKMKHFVDEITPDTLFENLVSIVWHLDEPIADPNIVSLYKMCDLSSSRVQTVFSGMGSDEFLAGHNRYTNEQPVHYMNRLNMIPSPIIKNFLIPLFNLVSKPAAYNILKISRTNPWQFDFLRHNAIFDETKLKEASPILYPFFDPDTFLHKFHNLSQIKSNVSSLLYFDVKTRLPDLFITPYERLTKIFGLDWKTPFLSRQLIEYAAGLPEPQFLSENDTASYLKPLTSKIFPKEFINRPKKNRPHFLSRWADKPEVFSIFQFLLRGTLIDTGIISEKWLREQLSSPESTRENFRMLWSILILEIWFHLFINHPIRATPSTTNLHELLTET